MAQKREQENTSSSRCSLPLPVTSRNTHSSSWRYQITKLSMERNILQVQKTKRIHSITHEESLVPSLPLILVPLWLFLRANSFERTIRWRHRDRLHVRLQRHILHNLGASMNSSSQTITHSSDGTSLAGIVLFLFLYSTKKKTFLDYYLLGAFIALPTYLIAAVNKLSGHNYHQYPIAMFILLFITYLTQSS